MKAWINHVVAVGIFLTSCTETQPTQSFTVNQENKNPWTRLTDPDNQFRFAIVSDRTGIPTPGVFASTIGKINHMQPDFVMSVGDLVEGYTFEGRITDLARIDADWNYITGLTNRLEMPFFYTVGNHDINSEQSSPLWENRFGRTYYHFRYGSALFLVLNTDDPPGTQDGGISNSQIDWIKSTISENQAISWTFVFMHRPLWKDGHPAWTEIAQLVVKERTTVFAGHLTEYSTEKVDGIDYFILAKTGSFSPGSPPPANDFDHIMWVTMQESGPVIANLLLDGIWGADPMTEAQGSPPGKTDPD